MTSTGYTNKMGHDMMEMNHGTAKKKSSGYVAATLDTTITTKKADESKQERSGSPTHFDNSLNVSSHDRPNLLESQHHQD
jgi:hypothetical protein